MTLAEQVCVALDAAPPADRDTAWTITRTAFNAPRPDDTAAASFGAITAILTIGIGQAINRERLDLADTLLDVLALVAADRAITHTAAREAEHLDQELAELTA